MLVHLPPEPDIADVVTARLRIRGYEVEQSEVLWLLREARYDLFARGRYAAAFNYPQLLRRVFKIEEDLHSFLCDFFCRSSIIEPEAESFLAEIHRCGSIVFVTNLPSRIAVPLLDSTRIRRYSNRVVTSDAVGTIKPWAYGFVRKTEPLTVVGDEAFADVYGGLVANADLILLVSRSYGLRGLVSINQLRHHIIEEAHRFPAHVDTRLLRRCASKPLYIVHSLTDAAVFVRTLSKKRPFPKPPSIPHIP